MKTKPMSRPKLLASESIEDGQPRFASVPATSSRRNHDLSTMRQHKVRGFFAWCFSKRSLRKELELACSECSHWIVHTD